MSSLRMKRVASVAAASTIVVTGVASGGSWGHGHHHSPNTIDVQLLSFNDFHGNLEPPTGSGGRITVGHTLTGGVVGDSTVDAGGVAYLATHLDRARRGHRDSLTVAAGDIVGASPLLSAAFHDEPTIEAMNLLGLDVTSVGNHEFDEGYKEVQRLAKGGCIDDGDGANNQNSCPDHRFKGADFDILAANVFYQKTKKTILPSYTIKTTPDGAKIAFIGMTLKDTPNIVTKSGIEGLEFKDEVATANALVPEIRRKGVNAIVVLIHQGGNPAKESWTGPDGKTYTANPAYNWACDKGGQLDLPSSPILGIASNLDPQIDMIVSGHTHQPYICNIPDPKGQSRLVTSASSFGRLFTETHLEYDLRKKDIVRSSVEGSNMIVTRDLVPNAQQNQLISRYKTLVAPIANRVLGSLATDVTRATNAGGESQLGDLIADAQLADPSVVTGGQTPVIALMNPGGIRADMQAGEVTFEEAFTVQPFNNYLVSMDLTGAQLKSLLTEQWSGLNAGAPKVLQVSEGFAYTYTGTTLGEVTLGGTPLVDTQTYRIVTNNFLSDGGDGFPTFVQGQNKYFGGLDIDAFANYLEAHSPYTPGPLDRITKN